MRAVVCLLLVALLVPGAQAQQLPGHVEVDAMVPFDAAGMIQVDWTTQEAAPDRSPCQRALTAATSGSDAHYLRRLPERPDGFQFMEGDAENGCAEARFPVEVPGGPGWQEEPSELVVTFAADRRVEQAAPASAPRAVQELRVYDGGPGVCAEGEAAPVAVWSYYRADAGVEPQLRPFTWRIALGELGTQRPEALCVGWYFGDQLRTESVGDLGVNQGQAFRASVVAPQASFLGGTVAADVGQDDGLSPDGKLVGFVAVVFDLSETRGPHERAAELRMPAGHGMHRLQAWEDGHYVDLPDGAYQAAEEEGLLRVMLGSAALDGPHDRFRLFFSAPDTATLQPTQALVAAPLLLLPVVAGVIAHRTVQAARHRAQGRLRHTVLLLQAVLMAAWAAFAAVVLLLLFTGTTHLLVAWPLGQVAVFAYLTVLLVTGVDLALVAWARGVERRLMRQDLTERDRMQRELERSNQELAQFAYVASHDLKEPLRMVSGYTQLLERRYADRLDDAGREFLGFASDGAERMRQMIDDLLAYSRVHPPDARQAEVDLADALEMAEGQLRGLIEERGARIEAGPLPRVHGDHGQFVQLFQNLIHNGIKFNKSRRPRIRISSQRMDGFWHITVQDNGVGIAPEQRERVFQIFQRLHPSSEYPGTGIGLALCRKIVEQAGGRIWAEAAPGKGAAFIFTWKDPSAAPGDGSDAAEAKVPRRREQRSGRRAGVARPG